MAMTSHEAPGGQRTAVVGRGASNGEAPTDAPNVRVIERRPRLAPERMAGRMRRERSLRIALGVGVPVGCVLLWQLASANGWIDRRLYPAPTDVWAAIRDLWSSGRLRRDVWDTLRIVLLGFVLGSLSGYLFGLITGLSKRVRAALEPILTALYVVPKLALLPIFLTVFGFASGPKIAMSTITVFFFVWIEAMEAMASVPAGYLEAAESCDVTRWQKFRHVYFPASLPQVFVSLRIAMGVAVLVTVASEFIIGGKGLGYLIFNSNDLFLIARAYAGIVLVSVLGVVLSQIISVVGRRATPWSQFSRHS
jgi:sulfonate transport system permease protein